LNRRRCSGDRASIAKAIPIKLMPVASTGIEYSSSRNHAASTPIMGEASVVAESAR